MKERREFLKFCTILATTLNLQGDETSDKLYLRPPGAINEKAFKASCIKCGQCVQVCPYHCIDLLDITHLFDIGTPVIKPNKRGCHLCDALPCVLACPSGALNHAISQPKNVKMGVAVISDINACLAFKSESLSKIELKKAKTGAERELNENLSKKIGQNCDLCVSFCPYPQPQNAIEMSQKDGRPAPVIKSECVGCGACAELCPAKIISIAPRASYKTIYKGI